MSTASMERELEAAIRRLAEADGEIEAALAPCPAEVADDLRPLLRLAADLEAGPRAPAPSASFRAALAARLAEAPPPSSLGRPEVAAGTPETARTTTRHLSHALDRGLARVASGDSPEQVVAELDDGAEEIAALLHLASALESGRSRTTPSAAFRRELASRLADAPPPSTLRPGGTIPGGELLQRLWRNTALMAAAAATVIIFIVSGLTVASADALPGEALYPVKRTVERTRLMLVGPQGALTLHLDFAGRRLDEAVAEPAYSGPSLADFSREVTAALAEADRALADGLGRDEIVEPLLGWLVDARGDLVVHRASLPPTAWRGARALVDEAILAFGSGAPLTDRPVPRMADPSQVLALRRALSFPTGWRNPQRSPVGGSVPSAPDATATAVPVAAADRGAGGAAQPVRARSVVVPPSERPTATPTDAPPPTREPEPDPQDTPEPDPEDTATPSPEPTDEPTSPPAETSVTPTDPIPATATPTDPPKTPSPVVGTATPTEPAPSPSPTSRPTIPTSIDVLCAPDTLLPAGRATCRVELTEDPPDGWDFQWSATLGSIVEADPVKDHAATYEATVGIQGVEKVFATITVVVEDTGGQTVEGTTIVYIVPRLDGDDGDDDGPVRDAALGQHTDGRAKTGAVDGPVDRVVSDRMLRVEEERGR